MWDDLVVPECNQMVKESAEVDSGLNRSNNIMILKDIEIMLVRINIQQVALPPPPSLSRAYLLSASPTSPKSCCSFHVPKCSIIFGDVTSDSSRRKLRIDCISSMVF